MVSQPISYFRYHDLTQRLSALSTNGGTLLQGSAEDLQIVDAEPLLASDEQEVGRLAGALTLIGPRSTKNSAEPSLGVVMEVAATLILTTQRLIVTAVGGMSQLGQIANGNEVHTFVLPWDLVDSISMAARRKLTDRIAGGRSIELMNVNTVMILRFVPRFREAPGGASAKISDDDAFALLGQTAAAHRLTVSPASEAPRLKPIVEAGRPAVDGDELIFEITDGETSGIPIHLEGRIVDEHGRPAVEDEPEPTAPPADAPEAPRDASGRLVISFDES